METNKLVGQTKDAGFQFGVRKTFPVSINTAWDFITSNEGLTVWLGKVNQDGIELNKAYKTKEGIEGKITVLKRYSHIRLTWKRKDWKNTSIVQIRVIASGEKTTISIHQEKLLNHIQREEMKSYWGKIMMEINSKFDT